MLYYNSISFHSDSLNTLTRAAYLIGDFFLTPVRYTLGCRTGTCFIIAVDKYLKNQSITSQKHICIKLEEFYGNIEEKKSSLLKTALSITLFVPCLIIGTVFKAPALLSSERFRKCYNNFEKLKKLEDKAYHELRIGIFFNKENHINNYSKYVEKMVDPDTFFNSLTGKSILLGGDRRIIEETVFKSIDTTQLSKLKDKEISSQDYLKKFLN